MSNFTKAVTETYEFDGDNVTVTFERLKRKHLVVLSPHMQQNADGESIMSFEDQVKFTDAAAEILPEIVKSFDGLIDADGNNIDLETVLEDTYFTKLVADIMGSIMSKSFMQDVEVKK